MNSYNLDKKEYSYFLIKINIKKFKYKIFTTKIGYDIINQTKQKR